MLYPERTLGPFKGIVLTRSQLPALKGWVGNPPITGRVSQPDSFPQPDYKENSFNAVYVKLYFNPTTPQRCYHQRGHFYIGSTGIGIPHREHNRRAKLKQLQNNVPISAELSLRYWHSHNNIHQFTPIQLSSHDTYDQAWVQEHYLISNWMPPLNWPFISHHLKLKAQGWHSWQPI